MKRMKCLAVIVAVLLLAALPVAAVSNRQQITLSTFGDVLMLSAEKQPASWEIPSLRAGEAMNDAGSLVLANKTDKTYAITLDHVALPFDDTAALDYLNHLHITVRDGDAVLYSGAYSRINDDGGLRMSYELASGEEVALTVDLRCDYTFAGEKTGFEGNTVIDWKFYTAVRNEVPESERPAAAFSDPALREILIAAAVAVLLLAGVGVYEILRRRR